MRCDGVWSRRYGSTELRYVKPLKKTSGDTSTSRRPVKFGSSARFSMIGSGEVPSSASWIGRLPVTFSHTGSDESNRMRDAPISTVEAPSPASMRRRCTSHWPSLLR